MPTDQEARSAFKGQNFMTPRAVEFGWVSVAIAYEISEGEGFDHEPIFGLTFRRWDGSTVTEPESAMFYSIDELRTALERAKEQANGV